MAVILGMTACNEEETAQIQEANTTQSIDEVVESAPNGGTPKRLRCTWTEWGRVKKGCDGGGLCSWNCEWEDVPVEHPLGTVFNDFAKVNPNGDFYLEIPITNSMPAENNYLTLPVDEDIYYTSTTGDTWLMEAGEYPLDPSIGSQGGYLVPLIEYN